MKSPLPAFLILTAAFGIAGCSNNEAGSLIRVEEFGVYTPTITEGGAAHRAGTHPKLRRKVRLYRFVFCEQGARFHNFAEVAPSFHSRFRRNRPFYSAERESRRRWEDLCGFNLLRDAHRSGAWLADVENQYVRDRGSYGRSFRKPHASNRSMAALRGYWCGKNGSVPRIAFSVVLKKRLIKSFPDNYIEYNPRIKAAQNSLREFCGSRGHESVREAYGKSRELRKRWDEMLRHAVFYLPTS